LGDDCGAVRCGGEGHAAAASATLPGGNLHISPPRPICRCVATSHFNAARRSKQQPSAERPGMPADCCTSQNCAESRLMVMRWLTQTGCSPDRLLHGTDACLSSIHASRGGRGPGSLSIARQVSPRCVAITPSAASADRTLSAGRVLLKTGSSAALPIHPELPLSSLTTLVVRLFAPGLLPEEVDAPRRQPSAVGVGQMVDCGGLALRTTPPLPGEAPSAASG
jgi:hypothetical protein